MTIIKNSMITIIRGTENVEASSGTLGAAIERKIKQAFSIIM